MPRAFPLTVLYCMRGDVKCDNNHWGGALSTRGGGVIPLSTGERDAEPRENKYTQYRCSLWGFSDPVLMLRDRWID